MDATDTELLGTRYYGCVVDELYNTDRPHSSLERITPQEKYLAILPQLGMAA
jgi:hypothetical protein